MHPLELADSLLDCPHFLDNQTVDEVCFEASVLIRKQHKMILKLRESLNGICTLDPKDSSTDWNVALNNGLRVLETTKEYDTSNSS